MNDIDIKPGWCCHWAHCGGVAVECVRAPGVEWCVPCAARELRLPEGTAAGNVVAALLREKERVAA